MKKRLIPVLLLLCICMMLIPVKAEAATSGICGNGVYFSFNESTGLLKIYGNGPMDDYRYYYGYSDTPWKDYIATIKKIEVGSGVTRIGNTAFNGCWNAESITIPATVTSIGSRAFYGCTALTSITIPSGVTAIESYTFYRTGITEIDLPDGITSLGNGAFAESSLTSIDIPAGVTTISVDLLANCDNLEKVTIRGDITNIGECAFYGAAVKEVVFEGTLSGEIGDHAFAYCENLAAFHVPGTVTEIRGYAFCGCEGMTELILEEGITSIGDSAFRETGISTLTIPSTVSYFGGRIADFSDNLKNVTMYTPTVEICKTWILNMRDLDYVHIIGDAPKTTVEVFSSTSQATDFVVYYDKGTSGWEGDTWNGYKIKPWNTTEMIASGTCGDNVTWVLDDTGLLTISGEGPMTNYTMPQYVPWYSYRNQVRYLQVEEGVTNLGDYACYGCANLQEVVLPESLERLGVVSLGGTKVVYVFIPSGVTEICDEVFSGCNALDYILVSDENTMYSSDDCGVLFNKDKTTLIRCPLAYDGAYEIPETVELVAEKAFDHCQTLTEVTVPSSVKELSRHSFIACTTLDSVHLNEGLEVIGNEAFMLCSALEGSLTIPATVTEVGNSAFDMTGLTELRFLDDMPQFGDYAFAGISLKVFYPAGNATWTAEKIEAIQGLSTFVPYGEPTVEWSSISTSLGGNIAMNFYVELSEDLVADPDAYMQFTFASKTVKVPLSEGVLTNGTYRFSCPITSKNMTDEITAQVCNADGPVGASKTMSVDTYCNWVIENFKDEKTVNLMKAMLNYGASAQMLFKYRTDDLANASLADSDKVFGAVDASAFLHSRTGEEDGIKPNSYTLLLDSETTVRCYFELTGTKSIDEFTFTVDGVEVQPKYKDGLYYIEKTNIAAHRLDDMHVFTCGNITITYGGLSYVNQVMTYYTSGTTFDMASALYAYSKAAEAYIG